MILALILLSVCGTSAHSVGDPGMAEACAGFLSKTSYPGAWFAVGTGDGVVAGSSGWADVEHRVRAEPDHELRIGSVSKPVVGSVVAYFVQRGSIDYDDQLLDVVGESNKHYRGVTLAHLLTHHSGLPRGERLRGVDTKNRTSFPDLRSREVAMNLGAPPLSAPGIGYAYSNVGFQAAAVMLEKRVGRPFEVLLDEVAASAFKLSSVGLGSPANGTQGYRMENGRLTLASDRPYAPYEYAAYAGIHLTISDLVKFGLIHCGAAPDALSARTLEQIHRPKLEKQTLSGFRLSQNGAVLFHSGSLTNYRGDATVLWVDPARKIVVGAHTNCSSVDGPEIKQLEDLLVRPTYKRILQRSSQVRSRG